MNNSPRIYGIRSLNACGKIAKDFVNKNPLTSVSFLYQLSRLVIWNILTEAERLASKKAKLSLDEWFDTYLKPKTESRTKTDYLKNSPKTISDVNLHVARVIDIAELVYNLQIFPNIHNRFYEMVRDPSKIEAIKFELEGFMTLFWAGTPFHVKPDFYECSILMPDGLRIDCEMKCKLEGNFTKSKIKDAFREAGKQLPKDGIGIMFLKVQPEWLADGKTQQSLFKIVLSELRSRTRIYEVMILARIPGGGREGTFIFELLNEFHARPDPLGKGFLGKRIQVKRDEIWIHFEKISTPDCLAELYESAGKAFQWKTDERRDPSTEGDFRE